MVILKGEYVSSPFRDVHRFLLASNSAPLSARSNSVSSPFRDVHRFLLVEDTEGSLTLPDGFQPFQGCPPVSTEENRSIYDPGCCVSSPFRDVHRFLLTVLSATHQFPATMSFQPFQGCPPVSTLQQWQQRLRMLRFQPFQGCPPVSTPINFVIYLVDRLGFQPFQGCPPVSTQIYLGSLVIRMMCVSSPFRDVHRFLQTSTAILVRPNQALFPALPGMSTGFY